MNRFNFDIDQFITSPFARFKGPSGGSPPRVTMPDTKAMKYARSELYPMVTRGLKGEGFGPPELSKLREESLYAGLEKTFKSTTAQFESQMKRTIDPADVRVKGFLTTQLQRAYTTAKDEIRTGIRAEKVADIDFSQSIAAEYLAGEKRMSINTAQMYNQALQRGLNTPSFATNVASGVGSGMVDYYFAQKMGA